MATYKQIQVTQWHIDTGKKKNCYECPISLAIHAAFPAIPIISVTDYRVEFRNRYSSFGVEVITNIDLPDAAIEFIEDFDSFTPVKPFTFLLEVNKNVR